jgi:predicted nucleic acid-binding Zn ribbon protein
MGEYSMGEAVQKFLNESRIKGSIQALQVEGAWEQIMGKTIARYTDSINIIDKTLFISTHVAPLKQELVFQREKIKLRVNEALGQNVINDVVIK